jgi:sigma-B regulation protein RsbU (phosphoserine phosphatase)
MANIAAIRIEHARLAEQEESRKLLLRELERAAEIQRRLLPSHAPQIAGLDLAGYNAPCRTVGGDYYDFLPYPGGRVALLIGDVSGKGLGAALLMSSLQARVQVFFENPENLGQQVCRLNRSVTAHCPGNCFITFVVAVLDTTTGELTYCNAGHNPPLLLHQNDDIELLEASGIPLGISRDVTYEQKSCRLERDDLLMLFSDGVTEACGPDPGQEFGEERLVGTVQRKRELPAASLIEAINAERLSFTCGAPAADDVTLVIARRY